MSRHRLSLQSAIIAGFLALAGSSAQALIVQNLAGTTAAPADDPGWNYIPLNSRNFVYLGDGWMLSAFHVGVPELVSDGEFTGGLCGFGAGQHACANESINLPGGPFLRIKGQEYIVKNPTGSGLSTDTDLRMIRINGDPRLAPTDPPLTPLNIASQQLLESTTPSPQVVLIGNGPSREASQTQWTVQVQAGQNNDIWTEVGSGGQLTGYKSVGPNVKRWGTNIIADEEALYGGGDNDYRGVYGLLLGVGQRDVMSMFTKFDASGLPNEAQVVSGDSGSGVFYKRSGVWELIGIVNALHPGLSVDNQSTLNAVYGNYTTFADMSYYRSEILSIMNAHPNYSLVGDVDLDGKLTGTISDSGVSTGDLAAFAAGWGYNTGLGSVTSWKHGDFTHDGKTDVADFLLLRTAFNAQGGGTLNFELLLGGAGVPEPSALILALAAMAGLLPVRRRRPRI